MTRNLALAGIITGGLLLAPIGFYATHIEPGMLDVERPPALAVAPTRAGTRPVLVARPLCGVDGGAAEPWVSTSEEAVPPSGIRANNVTQDTSFRTKVSSPWAFSRTECDS